MGVPSGFRSVRLAVSQRQQPANDCSYRHALAPGHPGVGSRRKGRGIPTLVGGAEGGDTRASAAKVCTSTARKTAGNPVHARGAKLQPLWLSRLTRSPAAAPEGKCTRPDFAAGVVFSVRQSPRRRGAGREWPAAPLGAAWPLRCASAPRILGAPRGPARGDSPVKMVRYRVLGSFLRTRTSDEA